MESKNISTEKQGELNTKNLFENLKSDYMLKIIFNIISKHKSLEIIKYNKKIQKRLNISIKDYKEYYEIHSSIEIEIIPIKNGYVNFINIDQNESPYYHIYFNDNKEEIKKDYLSAEDEVSKIKIIIDYQIKSLENLFYFCKCIESINFKKFYRNNINNMSHMFWNCSSLQELNLNNFNTNNVIDMSCMFYNCSSLKELNLNNFNTNKVTNMRSMFYNCEWLKELNLNNFNTNNVIDMSYMFFKCSFLKELNINNFNTNNVIDMKYMFYDCWPLKELNLNNFNTNKVTNMRYMFYNCWTLKELNLNNFNTNNVINMRGMFKGCSDELKMKIKVQYKQFNENAFD